MCSSTAGVGGQEDPHPGPAQRLEPCLRGTLHLPAPVCPPKLFCLDPLRDLGMQGAQLVARGMGDGGPQCFLGSSVPSHHSSGLGFLLLASLGGAPGSLALRTTGHGTERGDPPGPARRGRWRRTRRTVRDPGPALRGLDVHPAEGEGGPTGERLRRGTGLLGRPVPLPRAAGPQPSHRRRPLPLPSGASSLPSCSAALRHTQASGTGCSASSIPALFSFRGCPPKYPVLWRRRQPRRPPGNTLESLSRAGVGPLGQPTPAAGGRAFRG